MRDCTSLGTVTLCAKLLATIMIIDSTRPYPHASPPSSVRLAEAYGKSPPLRLTQPVRIARHIVSRGPPTAPRLLKCALFQHTSPPIVESPWICVLRSVRRSAYKRENILYVELAASSILGVPSCFGYERYERLNKTTSALAPPADRAPLNGTMSIFHWENNGEESSEGLFEPALLPTLSRTLGRSHTSDTKTCKNVTESGV